LAAPYVPEEAKGIYSEVQLAVTPPWQPPPAGASPFILSISEPGMSNVTSSVKFLRKNAGKVQGPELPGLWPLNSSRRMSLLL
jgi:hypothetical protein